jgi:hypothetical protein
MVIKEGLGSGIEGKITEMDCHRQRVKSKGADTDADWTSV